ncbi:hypothetical protein CVIRNUC_000256 [Coccomyxa viridis]|uniref:Prolyl endopeptidase n=1 Tax=Coccomyxa viridis TaxID=1274662 RepID=A0AAV1HQI3_9CHLO|nr:hypothetical protein CVIRNUC_000256 [Coccomyxa viridis]
MQGALVDPMAATILVMLALLCLGPLKAQCALSSARTTTPAKTSAVTPGQDGAVLSGVQLNPARYPYIFRNESVVSVYNSVTGPVSVPDPYRWLEDTSSKPTRDFLQAQKDVYDSWSYAKVNGRSAGDYAVRNTLANLTIPAPTCPTGFATDSVSGSTGSVIFEDPFFFLTTDDGGYIYFDYLSLGYPPGTSVVVSYYAVNLNMTWMAVGLYNGASDWVDCQILSINTTSREATYQNETLSKLAFYAMQPTWTPDGQSLLYQWYPHGSNASLEARGLNSTGVSDSEPALMVHRVKTQQSSDLCLLKFPGHPSWFLNGLYFSEDGSYLVATISKSTPSGKKIWALSIPQLPKNNITGSIDFSGFDLNAGNHSSLPWLKVVDDDFLNDYSVYDVDGNVWTVWTNYNAPNYMIVLMDVTQRPPQENWTVLVAQDPQRVLSLMSDGFKDDTLLLSYRKGLEKILQIRNITDGHIIGEYAPPSNASLGGSITKLCTAPNKDDFYFVYSTFDNPGILYRAPITGNRTFFVKQAALPSPYNATSLVTLVHYILSKDGQVDIPLLLLTQNGTANGSTSNPTLLYGYGGQNVVKETQYEAGAATFVYGYGGIYAKCLPRGGGDLGWDWWLSAHTVNKSKTADDFISCAQYLLDNNYTTSDNLVIEGASNGGLLMGMAVTKAPGLFAGVLAGSGIYDVLRLAELGEASAQAELGDPSQPDEVAAMLEYAPLLNIRQPNGTRQYPAMLITVGTADDRVNPAQSYKFVAQLQGTLTRGFDSPQRNPIVLRAREGYGHIGNSDRWTSLLFAAKTVNATWQLPIRSLGTLPDLWGNSDGSMCSQSCKISARHTPTAVTPTTTTPCAGRDTLSGGSIASIAIGLACTVAAVYHLIVLRSRRSKAQGEPATGP